MSKGELYTFVTNKSAKGKKKSIVACISGTKAEKITNVLLKLPAKDRMKVKEITLEMAANMSLAAAKSFPLATQVIDHFHVIRLALQAVQRLRAKQRWQEMDQENKEIRDARQKKKKYKPKLLPNGDTLKELLARSRFVVVKRENQWTETQKERANLVFENYTEIQKAYQHVIKLRNIYDNKDKLKAMTLLRDWIQDSRNIEIKPFISVANSLENHFETISASSTIDLLTPMQRLSIQK